VSAATVSHADLKKLPFRTLSILALAVAEEIDGGAEDRRELLERLLEAIDIRNNRSKGNP
jgi:hypothetical protein